MSVTKTAKTDKSKSRNKPLSNSKIVTKTSHLKKFKTLAKENKFIVALILIVILLLGALINQKYQDWDNAQMIKGLARDFPALVDEIEQATGLDLEVKYDCMQTQEKFTEGVNTCELSLGYIGHENVYEQLKNIVKNNDSFSKIVILGPNDFRIKYKDWNNCESWSAASDRAYFRCQINIRESNINLAKELLVYSE